jgi:two-component sensor histidine kinase
MEFNIFDLSLLPAFAIIQFLGIFLIINFIQQIKKKSYVRNEINYNESNLCYSNENVTNLIETIREKKQNKDPIKYNLNEKEILLQEILHRVKNNLQVIISLLTLEKINVKDNYSKELLNKIILRIHSMASIQNQLYKSKDLSNINFCEYLKQEITEISKILNINNNIFNLNIDEFYLNINYAIPCGLIINELITNAIKHAFPDKNTNTKISIIFVLDNDKRILQIRDNGIGFPPNFNIENINTLGLMLVKELVTQINGNIKIENDSGAKITIIF